MKQTVITFLLILSLSPALNAQQDKKILPVKKMEVSLSMGVYTLSQLEDNFEMYKGSSTRNPNQYTGGLFVTLRRSTRKNRFCYGITAGYDGMKGTFNDFATTRAGGGTYKTNHFTIAVEGQFTYYTHGSIRIYGLAGFGHTTMKYQYTHYTGEYTTDKQKTYNFQATPIGVSYGKNIGGFLEAGFGYKGMINAGVYARF